MALLSIGYKITKSVSMYSPCFILLHSPIAVGSCVQLLAYLFLTVSPAASTLCFMLMALGRLRSELEEAHTKGR